MSHGLDHLLVELPPQLESRQHAALDLFYFNSEQVARPERGAWRIAAPSEELLPCVFDDV
jgi:hypothetical protein